MNFPTYIGSTAHSSELEPILDALAQINVELRHILQISTTVVLNLEMRGRIADTFEKTELESKSQSILLNMARTEEAIGNINREISTLLGRGATAFRSRAGHERTSERSRDRFRIVSEP